MPEAASVIWGVATGLITLLLGVVGYFLKRTMTRTDKHDEDINHIKQTYVTKAEVKELKNELRGELKQLTDDVGEIKEKVLYKDDFYRTIVDVNRNIEKLQNYLFEKLGGGK